MLTLSMCRHYSNGLPGHSAKSALGVSGSRTTAALLRNFRQDGAGAGHRTGALVTALNTALGLALLASVSSFRTETFAGAGSETEALVAGLAGRFTEEPDPRCSGCCSRCSHYADNRALRCVVKVAKRL